MLVRESGGSASIKVRFASITVQAACCVDYTLMQRSGQQLVLDDCAVLLQLEGWLTINRFQVFLKSCVNEQF